MRCGYNDRMTVKLVGQLSHKMSLLDDLSSSSSDEDHSPIAPVERGL